VKPLPEKPPSKELVLLLKEEKHRTLDATRNWGSLQSAGL